MANFAMIFNVLEGGVSTPIKWEKEALQPDRSLIIMDESNMVLYLWHGVQQGLVARGNWFWHLRLDAVDDC